MWRFKLILFFTFFTAVVNAQREPDSVFFVKYASPLDLLLPSEGDQNYMDFARDSASFFRNGAGKMLTVYETTTDFTGKKTDVDKEFSRYIFRSDGQVSSYGNWTSDSALLSREDYVYLRTGEVSRIIRAHGNPLRSDTTKLTYDRTGKLASYCEKGECILRLYNSKQQLLVKGNALYGYIRGDYTYAYDDEGRLVQRSFLEKQSGIVLCTDTIQYSFMNDEKTILSEKHFIRIAGKEEWLPIDEMLAETALHKILRYDLFYSLMRSPRGVHAPGYIAYTYDAEGNLLLKEQKDRNGEETTSYQHFPLADTIKTMQIMRSARAKLFVLSCEKVITYDPNGLIASVTSTDYTIKKHYRYWKNQSACIREKKYSWH